MSDLHDDSVAGSDVAVLMGGRSGERAVSLDSGREVARALADASLAGRGPARVEPVEIDADGCWRVDDRALSPAEGVRALAGVDQFFLTLHGGHGEDGTIQGLLESEGRCYTGSDVAASAVAMDKAFTRELLACQGLRVARGRVVTAADWRADRAGVLDRCRRLVSMGWVVKPRRGGSSVGVARIHDVAELEPAIETVVASGEEALVEAGLEGVELTCGVLGNRGESLRALTPLEIRPAQGRFFDYQQKYSADGAEELCPPRSVDEAMCAQVRALALAAHRELRCDGYTRSDFILPHGEREPVFLELNTSPGMTARSLLPQAAAHDGLPFPELCLAILEAGQRRHARGG